MKETNRFLYFATAAVNFGSFTFGEALTWTSPVIPKLKGELGAEYNPLQENITPSQESWIASILPLAGAIGPFVTGFLSDKIGRKKTLLVTMIPVLIGYIMKAFATDIKQFYLARFLCGIGVGGYMAVLPMYVGEIAENNNRGTLGCFMASFVTAGNIFSFAIGPYVSVMWMSLASLLAPLLFLILFGLFVPESPYYLIAGDNVKDAEISLKKLRTKGEDKLELLKITKSLQDSCSENGGVSDLFKEKHVLKALAIALGLVIFQQYSGISVMMFYLQSIFQATGSKIAPDISTITIGLVQFLSCILACALVDKIGRRPLLILSAFGNTVSLSSLGLYFHLKNTGEDVDGVFWLPIASLVMYMICFSVGFGALPLVILSELFPPNVKAIASTITVTVGSLASFSVIKFFPIFIDVFGGAFSFWIFASCCLLSGLFAYFLVPETKDRSLQEVQELLSR